MSYLHLFSLFKNFLIDIKILEKTDKYIQRYKEKSFKQILQIAMKTPLYQGKYADIDIKSIKLGNITELPILTKNDIRNHSLEDILPTDYNRKKALMVSTSGSTGKPTTIFTDSKAINKALMAFIREIRAFNINWRTKMSIIVDLTPQAIEEAYLVKGLPYKPRNVQLLHVGDDVEEMIGRIDGFGPRFIGGYPGALRALAVLKRRGLGGGICPDVIASSGAVLDEYTRRYIEESFGCRVFDVYGSTEAGPVAFECGRGRYHVHSDLVHLEFLGEDLRPVEAGCPGRVVVTKLYGGATPIIRYDGLNDFVMPLAEHCDCGIRTHLIDKIGGRKADSIILPDGSMIPPSAITGIPGKVMEEYNTTKILQFQILQKTLNHVEVRIVIDETLRNVGPTIEELFQKMQEKFNKRFKDEITVDIIEVSHIEKPIDLDTPAPVVTSLVC